jgi:hypothetical protein
LELRPIIPDEHTIIKEYLMALKPVAEALDVLQGEEVVTAGYLLPTRRSIIQDLDVITSANLKYLGGMVSAIKEAIQHRFPELGESSWFTVAAAVHPKFKMFWVPDAEIDFVTAVVKAKLREQEDSGSEIVSDTAMACDTVYIDLIAYRIYSEMLFYSTK